MRACVSVAALTDIPQKVPNGAQCRQSRSLAISVVPVEIALEVSSSMIVDLLQQLGGEKRRKVVQAKNTSIKGRIGLHTSLNVRM